MRVEVWQALCHPCWRLSKSIGTGSIWPARARALEGQVAALESENADLRLAGAAIPEAMLWDLLDLCDPARHGGDPVAIGAVVWLHDQRGR
jgi:hypothetical protein